MLLRMAGHPHLENAAEAAEIHFARAKDATKLYEAIELKLTEQRRIVLWWDGQEKAAGELKRGSAPASQPVTTREHGQCFLT